MRQLGAVDVFVNFGYIFLDVYFKIYMFSSLNCLLNDNLIQNLCIQNLYLIFLCIYCTHRQGKHFFSWLADRVQAFHGLEEMDT